MSNQYIPFWAGVIFIVIGITCFLLPRKLFDSLFSREAATAASSTRQILIGVLHIIIGLVAISFTFIFRWEKFAIVGVVLIIAMRRAGMYFIEKRICG